MSLRAAAFALLALSAPGCARSEPPAGKGMSGTLFEGGRVFGQKYCSPCHSKGARHSLARRASLAFTMNTFDEWRASRTVIADVLDKWRANAKLVMPPPEAPGHPADEERRAILAWLRRGLPNTPDGM